MRWVNDLCRAGLSRGALHSTEIGLLLRYMNARAAASYDLDRSAHHHPQPSRSMCMRMQGNRPSRAPASHFSNIAFVSSQSIVSVCSSLTIFGKRLAGAASALPATRSALQVPSCRLALIPAFQLLPHFPRRSCRLARLPALQMPPCRLL